jgi:hypothetical protein
MSIHAQGRKTFAWFNVVNRVVVDLTTHDAIVGRQPAG